MAHKSPVVSLSVVTYEDSCLGAVLLFDALVDVFDYKDDITSADVALGAMPFLPNIEQRYALLPTFSELTDHLLHCKPALSGVRCHFFRTLSRGMPSCQRFLELTDHLLHCKPALSGVGCRFFLGTHFYRQWCIDATH